MARAQSRPVIGLTLDYETPDASKPLGSSGGYSRLPWYAIRENYCAAVARAGGLPLLLPHEVEQAAAYVERLDGLVVTGGAFELDPALFGATSRHATVTTKERRTAFEWAVTKAALDRDLPLLGICGGQQLLNVVLGGSLIQHIPDEVEDALEHESAEAAAKRPQAKPRNRPGRHDVAVVPGSLLHRICGATELAVNSSHHQAVKAVGPGVAVNARAPDGVIEGIEAPALRFCLGVQWHPEYGSSSGDAALFEAFVAAAAGAHDMGMQEVP
ncbi:MAG: gamma-glutamyl-gamma-aminobutyrate hydrolase family protein [Kiloniellales bacterium]